METLALSNLLPVFTGDGELQAREYCSKISKVVELLAVPAEAQVSLVHCTTKGPANRFVERFLADTVIKQEDKSFKKLLEALQKAFTRPEDPRVLFQALETRVRKPGEGMRSFAQDILDLCIRADPTMSASRQADYVRHGLSIDTQRELLAFDFATPDELITAVEKVEDSSTRLAQLEAARLLQSSSGTVAATSNWSAPVSADSQLRELTSAVRSLVDQLADPAANSGDIDDNGDEGDESYDEDDGDEEDEDDGDEEDEDEDDDDDGGSNNNDPGGRGGNRPSPGSRCTGPDPWPGCSCNFDFEKHDRYCSCTTNMPQNRRANCPSRNGQGNDDIAISRLTRGISQLLHEFRSQNAAATSASFPQQSFRSGTVGAVVSTPAPFCKFCNAEGHDITSCIDANFS